MNTATILAIINGVSALIAPLVKLVSESKEVLASSDKDQIEEALRRLQEQNRTLFATVDEALTEAANKPDEV